MGFFDRFRKKSNAFSNAPVPPSKPEHSARSNNGAVFLTSVEQTLFSECLSLVKFLVPSLPSELHCEDPTSASIGFTAALLRMLITESIPEPDSRSIHETVFYYLCDAVKPVRGLDQHFSRAFILQKYGLFLRGLIEHFFDDSGLNRCADCAVTFITFSPNDPLAAASFHVDFFDDNNIYNMIGRRLFVFEENILKLLDVTNLAK